MSVLHTVIQKTVDAFAGITNRRLWVRHDKQVSTDGNRISVPLDDPKALRFVEKMLAHILFQTNQPMLDQFCIVYAHKIAATCKQTHNKEISPEQQKSLQRLLADFTSVLEVHRVISLWGMIYEGSYAEIKLLKRLLNKPYALQAHQSLAILAAMCEAEVVIPAHGKYETAVPLINEALKKVELKGPTATPLVAKWLLIKLIDQALSDDDGSRVNALQKVIDGSAPLPEKIGGYYSQVKPSTFNSTFSESQAKKDADAVINAPVGEELDKQLEATAEAMMQAVQKVKKTMGGGNGLSPEERITKDAPAKIVFHDVVADPANPTKSCLLPEDATIVRRLRKMFEQVRSHRRSAVFNTGLRVDSMAYIQHVLSGESRPVFKEEIPGRGFDILILMDRSSSMGGVKKIQVERAGKILAEALKYPFVNLHMWGFQSLEPGQVDIHKFQANLSSYDSPTAQVGGFTPLHIATHVAWKFLAQSRNAKRLFVLSDGVPNYHRRDGLAFNRDQLVEYVRDEVKAARAAGIGVTGAVVESLKVQKVNGQLKSMPDYSRRHYQKKMFGSDHNWRYLRTASIGEDLVSLVATSFAGYLRGG